MIRNYVFDLYGTLIDIHTDEKRAKTWKKWCAFLDEKGLIHPDYKILRRDFFAMDARNRLVQKKRTKSDYPEIDIIDVYRELFDGYGNGTLDDEVLKEVSYAFRVASREYIRLFPGVTEYLQKLKKQGNRIFILSNAQRSYTWPEIEMFELDKLTDDQFISSDFGVMKPDKAFYDKMIDGHQLDRAETLMHGDSLDSDVMGANNAEIKSIHLTGNNAPEKYYLKQIQEV